MLEIRLLRYFVAVFEEAHMGRAAERLHVSQPALSQQIQKLEAQLDASLFDRAHRQLRPSYAAHVLYRHAVDLLARAAAAETEVRRFAGSGERSLTLGVLQSVNAAVVPRLVARMGELCPQLRLNIAEMSGDEVEQGVAARRLQLGIGFAPAGEAASRLLAEPLLTDRFCVLMPAEHRLASFHRLALHQVCAEPLILLSANHTLRRLWDAAVREHGLLRPPVAEMNRIAAIAEAVRLGRGLTVLPEFSARSVMDPALCCRPLAEPEIRRTVSLLRHPATNESEVEMVVQEVRSLVAEVGLGGELGV
ncbi:LysR family transcriptional regulator [Azoarcus indigens]|uniref:LysR family cyn operon transcriptional activator n=1 Tax=Azoarcus indigens TaxID=29545 RepID=A0A4R6DRS5_9RHOO|nr:LysR substrate-binding domain-containing protein [Azoarcus indigens]TDN47746.1 LysR family cyn operon transcriptional activator [Azoarcus indigens]